jgi:hypothetical protein
MSAEGEALGDGEIQGEGEVEGDNKQKKQDNINKKKGQVT